MDRDRFKQMADVSPTTFTHKGVMVDEFIVAWDNSKYKLMWVKSGCLFRLKDFDGVDCPIAHTDLDSLDTAVVTVNRRRVAEAFDKHYNL